MNKCNVFPMPWVHTSFRPLGYWVLDELESQFKKKKNFMTDYAEYKYSDEVEKLVCAMTNYGECHVQDSRNGYFHKLSKFLENLPIDPIDPVVPPIIPPRPIMSPAPKTTHIAGQGATTLTIVAGGSGYKFGDVLTVDTDVEYPAQIRVTAVDTSGAVTTAQVRTPGVYPTPITTDLDTKGGAGTGAKFKLSYNASSGSSIYAGKAIGRTDASFTYWGSDVKDVTPGYRGNGVGNGTQMRVNWKTDAQTFDIKLAGLNSKYTLYVDGQRISATPFETGSNGAISVYTVTFADKKMREFSLAGINSAFGGIIIGVNDTVEKSDAVCKVWQMGDSYTFGTMATQPSFNDFRVMCDQLNVNGLADGIGGSGWTSTGSTAPQQRITSKLNTLTFTPEFIILSLGYNDAPAGRIDLLKTNFAESYDLIKTKFPDATVIVIGPATPQGATPELDVIREATMGLSKERNLKFVDVRNLVNKDNEHLYTSNDNVHPNDAGYAYRGSIFATELKDIIK